MPEGMMVRDKVPVWKRKPFLILLFVVATAVAIAVQRLAVPDSVALVFTGLELGLLHAFEAPT